MGEHSRLIMGKTNADDIFKCIFLDENLRISSKLSFNYVHHQWSNWQYMSIGVGNITEARYDQKHINLLALPLFIQLFTQADIKGNIKAPHHWPFVKGIHRWAGYSLHKEPVKRKMFPFHDVFMNGWAPNRRQAIIGTNDDPIDCHIYASPGLKEFRLTVLHMYFVWNKCPTRHAIQEPRTIPRP